MANTAAVKPQVLGDILAILRRLEKDVAEVKEKLAGVPAYGSDEWWEWTIKKSEEDFKAGNYTTVKTKKELREFFDNL